MKVGIVNDQALAVTALRCVLEASGQHTVAWVARDGREALAHCETDKPELILMDLHMPGMDGVTATRLIMQERPCPILITTATVSASCAEVFEALGAGAIDAVNTPVLGCSDPKHGPGGFLAKLDRVVQLLGPAQANSERTGSFATARAGFRHAHTHGLVVIGCSAGGPAALAALLGALPVGIPAGIVVVQHVDEQFAAGLAEWLNQRSPLPVRLAREGDRPTPGLVQLAGSADHLVLFSHDTLGYQLVPRDTPYRPSIDVFFDSVVQHWRGRALGVLLTGMGQDGARGLKSLRDAGHFTLAQDQGSCAVYGMPKAAAALNAATEILPLERIAARLVQQLGQDQTQVQDA
jgi:two-component system response regulator WspF